MLHCWDHHIYLNTFSFNIITFTWAPNIVILHNNPVTYDDIMYPMWNLIFYLIQSQWIWQWYVIIFHSDSRWFIHFYGGVPHFMTDPVQTATWQFETPEVSQTMFHSRGHGTILKVEGPRIPKKCGPPWLGE